MRADVAPLAANLLYLVAGAALLLGTGIVRTGRELVAATGLAYVCGLVAVLLAGTWLLTVGVPFTAPVTAAVAALATAGGAVAWLRRRRRGSAPALEAPADRPRAGRGERAVVGLLAAGLLVYLVLGYLASRRMVLAEWDAWSIWTRKAVMLLQDGTPPEAFFAADRYAFMHPDYPLLVPLMEQTWFRFAGTADTVGVHAQFWLLFAGALGAAAWVVGRGSRAVAWLPVLGLVAVAPGLRGQLLTMYADVPMALFLGLGALLVGAWLRSGDRRELGLGVLLLAGAASTKNEGVTGAVAVLAAAIVVTLVAGSGPVRSRLRGSAVLLVAAGAWVLTILPWRVWLAVQGIGGDMPIAKGLDPGYLAGRTERLQPAWDGLIGALADQGAWIYLVPLGAAAALAGLLTGGLRRVGAYYLVAGLLLFASLLWAFWISPNEIGFHVATAAPRIVDAVVLVAAAAALHLAGGRAGPQLRGDRSSVSRSASTAE